MTLRIALAVFISIAALIAAFAFFIPHTNQGSEEPSAIAPSPITPEVTLKDSYTKGSHTIAGSILAPTPCTSVTALATVASGTPQTISIEVLMPPDTGICIQQASSISFAVSARAEVHAVLEASVNGVTASTTLR